MTIEFINAKNGYMLRVTPGPAYGERISDFYIFKTWEEVSHFIQENQKLLTGEKR